MSFLKMVCAAFIGQVLVWILVQGFERSYFGKNAVEEITRIWNSMSKHMKKQKEQK